MARVQKRILKDPPHLSDLAASFVIRRSIRHFIGSGKRRFVALLQIPDDDDCFVYEAAAKRLLGVGSTYDDVGNDIAFVGKSADFEAAPWKLVNKLKHVWQVVIFCDDIEKVSEDVRLLVDFDAVVQAPAADHLRAAAGQLFPADLSVADAEFLATQRLWRIRLAMPSGRSATRGLQRLRRQVVAKKPANPAPQAGPSLNSLSGYGEAKDWGLQLARDLVDWKAGRIGWEEVDKGIVLSGPPGCGKTLFATALANTCNIPVLVASAGRWQSEGHLGDMLKAMRRFFLNAKKNAPCIAFIDEFDSFGDRAVRSDSTNYDYKRQVINALLECLDPSEGRTGVVVVGATNSASQIDPALLRPGRLERVVNISLPDLDARIAILRHHLPSETDEISFVDVGADTEGWSGADIEKLARDAKRYCRRRGGDLVSQVDIKAALPTFQRLTEEERMRVAVHEAGHALLSVALDPGNLVKVRVGRHKLVGEAELGTTTFNREAGLLETEQQLTDRVVVLLGGMVAEGIVFGDHSTGAGGGRDSDLARATGLATMMESAFGFGEFLASDPEVDLASLQKLRMSHRDIARKVDARLSACRNRAREILSQQKVALLSVARDLVAHGELEADAVVHLASLELAGDGVERSVIARTQVLI